MLIDELKETDFEIFSLTGFLISAEVPLEVVRVDAEADAVPRLAVGFVSRTDLSVPLLFAVEVEVFKGVASFGASLPDVLSEAVDAFKAVEGAGFSVLEFVCNLLAEVFSIFAAAAELFATTVLPASAVDFGISLIDGFLSSDDVLTSFVLDFSTLLLPVSFLMSEAFEASI